MLMPQIYLSNPGLGSTARTSACLIFQKPCLQCTSHHPSFQTVWSRPSFQNQKTQKRLRNGCSSGNKIKAVAVSEAEKKSVKVKATITVQPTVGGFFSELGLDRGLDDITDLLGKSLLLELACAALDPKTGLEKETIKGYVHKTEQSAQEVKYEAEFEVPDSFGDIGAIFVENEHHKEMFIKDVVLDGFLTGPVHISCNSWVHSKHDSPVKRFFFANKSCLPSQTPEGLRRLREEELQLLRGNGQGERKASERIYDYDVYNDLGDPDSNIDLKRPVLGGKQHPYPRRCRTGGPRCETGMLYSCHKNSLFISQGS